MERYDITIIGTGPAGVSAAITAKVREKNLLLIGSRNLSDKMRKAHGILNYPGLPGVTGEQLCDALSKHLEAMDIEVTEAKVGTVYPMGDYFSIQAGQEIYETSTVILATGVSFGKPFPGEMELLGRGVSYCATCDAPFYKGKKVAVIGYGRESEEEADFLSEVAGEVLYVPMYKEDVRVSDKVSVVRELPVEIQGGQKVEALRTKEQSLAVDGVFILRSSIAPSQLVPGLDTQEGHVKVNLDMETNLPGCFACGDLAGKPYQYIKAAGQGNIAALSAVKYLQNISQ